MLSAAGSLPTEPAAAARPARMRIVLGAAAALITALAWRGILRTYFRGDDFLHLYNLRDVGAWEMVLWPFGGHMYVVRNGIMALTFWAFGLEPLPFFTGVLATHLVNTVLVFVLGSRVAGDARLGFLAALLFGVSPMHVGTLGWYSVYGHMLACSLMLCILLVLVPRAASRAALSVTQALAVVLLALAASQSFGTGAGVALATPLVAVVLRPATLRRRVAMALLCGVPVLVILAARFLFFRASPLGVGRPVGSDAHLFLVFFRDVHAIMPMLRDLIGLGVVTLVLGPAYPVASYPDAFSTIILLAVGLAVGILLLRADGARRRVAAALLILLVATAGSIAAGRATIISIARSKVGPLAALRARDSRRYSYQLQAVSALLLGLALGEVTRRWSGRAVRGVLVAAWTTAALAFWIVRRPTLEDYASTRALVSLARDTMAREIAQHPPGTTVCLALDGRADGFFPAGRDSFPGYAAIFMLLYPADTVDGRRVYFVTADPVALGARNTQGRTASLLLPAASCPPPGTAWSEGQPVP